MKRILSILIVVIITFIISGCTGSGSKANKASNKAISIAKQAIEIVDGYLDGSNTYEVTYDTLKDLHEEMDYVSDLAADDENRFDDFQIQMRLFILYHSIYSDYYDGDAESYDNVIAARNGLATDAGIDLR